MTRVAFVNMGCYTSWYGRKSFAEPVHLLGMHNICQQNGHESRIFQYGAPSDGESLWAIREYKPNVLGLSFIGHFEEAIVAAHKLVKSFPAPRPSLLMGGTDIDVRSDFYAEEFGQYYQGSLKDSYFVMVLKKGEALVAAFASCGFDLDEAFRRLNIGARVKNNAITFAALPSRALDQIGFMRDYDFSAYNHRAQVKWGSGCWGKCGFCSNEFEGIDHRSPLLVLEEIEHLRSLEVESVNIASPNFTADSKRATSIVKVLPFLQDGYQLPSRVDSLYQAIREDEGAWKNPALFNSRIDLGVERFHPEGLVRIGKYQDLDNAREQDYKLRFILDFFKNTRSELYFFLILLDWQMDLEEADFEAQQLRIYANEYENVRVMPEVIGKEIHYTPGSRFSTTMRPIDFLRFERDPRLLFLNQLMKAKLEDLGWFVPLGNMKAENIAGRFFLEYYITCIQILRDIPVNRFKLDSPLSLIEKGASSSRVLRAFYSQLGFWEGRKLKKHFNAEFDKMVERIREKMRETFVFF